MNHSWMSAIIRSENSVENRQVFWPWSSLRMSACTVPRTTCRAWARMPAASSAVGSRPCSPAQASTARSMTVLRKKARMVGAGPLIVIETLVVGEVRSKPAYSSRMSSRVATETPEVPTLP